MYLLLKKMRNFYNIENQFRIFLLGLNHRKRTRGIKLALSNKLINHIFYTILKYSDFLK